MTADIELLPLPEASERNPFIGHPCYFGSQMQDYARANMEPLIAEIEALRRELDRLRGEHVRVRRDRNAAQARAERLAEALHKLEEACDDSDGAQYGTLGTAFVRGICKDALRDHDQEGKDG